MLNARGDRRHAPPADGIRGLRGEQKIVLGRALDAESEIGGHAGGNRGGESALNATGPPGSHIRSFGRAHPF